MSDLGFENLGFLNLAIIYFVFSIASMFGGKVQDRLGNKYTLFLCSLTYAMWIAGFIIPASIKKDSLDEEQSSTRVVVLIIVTATLIGLGAGPLWVT